MVSAFTTDATHFASSIQDCSRSPSRVTRNDPGISPLADREADLDQTTAAVSNPLSKADRKEASTADHVTKVGTIIIHMTIVLRLLERLNNQPIPISFITKSVSKLFPTSIFQNIIRLVEKFESFIIVQCFLNVLLLCWQGFVSTPEFVHPGNSELS